MQRNLGWLKETVGMKNVIHLTLANSCHSTRYDVILESYITVFI